MDGALVSNECALSNGSSSFFLTADVLHGNVAQTDTSHFKEGEVKQIKKTENLNIV